MGQKMRTLLKFIAGATLLGAVAFGAWALLHHPDRPSLGAESVATLPSQPGLTLWQPRPGSVYRVWEQDGVAHAEAISNYLADQIRPEAGAALDASFQSGDQRVVAATANFLGELGAKASGSLYAGSSIFLKTRGTEVYLIPPRSDFLVKVQDLDIAKNKDAAAADLFAKIDRPEVWLRPQDALYVITEIRKASRVEYGSVNRERDRSRAGCQAKESEDCVGMRVDRNVDQVIGLSTGDRPRTSPIVVFVAMKPLIVRDHNIRYDQSAVGPSVVAGS